MQLLRKSLQLAVLFLLLSVACFSDVVLTDEEFLELETIYKRFGTLLDAQETQLNALKTALETAENELTTSTQTITSLEISTDALEASLQEQNADALKTTVIASLISLVVGLVAGLLL